MAGTATGPAKIQRDAKQAPEWPPVRPIRRPFTGVFLKEAYDYWRDVVSVLRDSYCKYSMRGASVLRHFGEPIVYLLLFWEWRARLNVSLS